MIVKKRNQRLMFVDRMTDLLMLIWSLLDTSIRDETQCYNMLALTSFYSINVQTFAF